MTALDLSALRALQGCDVLCPEDTGFDLAHLGFNLAVQHCPDAVVRAAEADHVAAAVRFAGDRGLPVRVQATGHGVGVPMDGGLLVNTAGMQGITIDPVSRTVTVAAGVRWHDVIEATAEHGLATLCGSSPTVGVVGYTLGGGLGPMARTFGFASDQVKRLRMIDATGRTVDVDPVREPELFWALRGGKPAIGIVTEMEFGLVDAPTYFGGAIFYPGDQAHVVLHTWARWAPTLPDSVTTSIALLRLPDVPEVPEPLRGRLSVQLRFVHLGSPQQGAELLAPMRAAGPVLIDLVDVTPARAIASVHQDPTDPLPARDDSLVVGSLPPEAIDALLAVAGPDVDVPLIVTEIRLMGGAVSRPGEHDSAVGGRDGAFNVCVIGPYPPPLVEAVDACMAAALDAVHPWATGGTLINFQGYATDPGQVRAAWSPDIRQRLDAVEQAWDPTGVFRFSYPVIGSPTK